MSGGYVSFYNASSVFSDAELQSVVPDLQSQISNEFWWYWGIDCYLDINGWGAPIIIVDYPGASDPQGALGYHWIDNNFQPYAVIFAGLCNDYGYAVSGVLSHELMEMAADQQADTWALYDFGDGTGIIIIQEVADPCENSLYYEAPNGNIVSDFALPGWWQPGYPYQVDFLGAISGPWALASGGYITYDYITLGPYQQAFGAKLPATKDPQRDLARLAELSRQRIAASGNARVDTVARLRGHQEAAGQKQLLDTSGRPLGKGPDNGAARRVQAPMVEETGRGASKITVVKRADVPQISRQGGQTSGVPDAVTQARSSQPAGRRVSTPRAREQRAAGPKVQTPANT
ncbi:hypothetical protein SAMN04515671_3795 [Nakamurella panacisegetis]|uniref:Uncharacterized protein n=1 Tax=Nakamurella panacisegetis TaxID=1090615 RepID=A0A1H0RYX0_9ACTN|nr:hypothetical protein [Nakamurella panacisegetis]SDP34138.1 hypothetical protein SAMN04515671_3795 [Nakamurella panacisegetis]